MSYRFSIIVPAYNRGHIIATTLNSLINQSYPNDKYEIIVVDNNSTDNTKDIILNISKSSPVKLTYLLEERQGVHFARNTASKKACGEYLYFTDDDMEADHRMLESFHNFILIHPEISVASGQVCPKWEIDPPNWILKYFSIAYYSLQNRSEKLIISDSDFGVYSCHQLIKRDVFMQSCGFHPEYTGNEWLGDGETGLNKYLQSNGHIFAYIRNALTWHLIPKERISQSYLNKRFANQGCADSYTYFREFNFTNIQIFKKCIKHLMPLFITIVWYFVLKFTFNKLWHLKRCYISYWISRMKYDYRLSQSSEFRKFVLKDNWM